MLSHGDIDKSFLEVFDSMEEGIDYELTSDAFVKLNKLRKANGYTFVKPFAFQRKGGSLIFDWKDNDWWKETIEVDRDNPTLAVAFAAGFAFTFAFTFAFAENRIQKVKTTVSQSCEGKTVVIEGIEYELRIKK